MVKVNGKELDAAGKRLSEYLAAAGYEKDRIAVEVNEEIIPKSAYESTLLKDQDVVEVVSFIGGG